MARKLIFNSIFICLPILCQAQLFRPFDCGPALKEKDIQVFARLNEYLGLRSGVVFGEVGASAGYYNGAMAVFTENVTFYIQDIDTNCLNEDNFKKVLKFYSKYSDVPLDHKNEFHMVIGEETRTNLPEDTFDVIFMNATLHVLSEPDDILESIYVNLKKDGTLSIRDDFVYDGSEKVCNAKECSSMVLKYEDMISMMDRNGFQKVGESKDFGYPVYTFEKK